MNIRDVTLSQIIITIARMILHLEWVWIGVMIFAFWHLSPPIRDRYVFLLGFAVPIYGARWLVHRRFFTRTPLDALLLIFAVATVYNFYNAPISRESYWVLVCRPFLGILIIWYFAEHVRQQGHMRYLIVVTLLLGMVTGGVALVASQWFASDKSELFAFILNILPTLDHRQILPDMQLSFNPNEIAGALTYFVPFSLAIALGSYLMEDRPITTPMERIISAMTRWGAWLCFALTASALFLGQSRFALAGAFVGLMMVILFVLPGRKLKLIGVVIWSVFFTIEIMIVTNVLPLDLSSKEPPSASETLTPLDERDERTFLARFELWDRAIQMVRDYPTTGAGMSTYRALVMQDEYMIPMYAGRQFGPPHAHNAFFQLGADLGVIGLVLFVGWYGMVVWMAFQTYGIPNLNSKIMTIAITSGILSYMGYGLGDTITLWDRFAFLHWWFIALIVGVTILKQITQPSQYSNNL